MSATAGRCADANSRVRWQLCYDVSAQTWWMVSESFHFTPLVGKLTGCCVFVQAAAAMTRERALSTFTFLTASSAAGCCCSLQNRTETELAS